MTDYDALYESSLHELKAMFPLHKEEQIINALLENKCNLEATAQEIVLLAPPSSPPSQRPLVLPTTAATGNAKKSTMRSKSMHRILLTGLPEYFLSIYYIFIAMKMQPFERH